MVDIEQSLNPDHTGLHNARQWVICLTTGACLTADPGVAISIPFWTHNFVEIDREIISMVTFLHSTETFLKDKLSELYAQPSGHESVDSMLIQR